MLDAIKHTSQMTFFFQEDIALVRCACATQSNCCSALDFLSPEPCLQQSLAERIYYKIYGVIQQREYES